MFQLLAIYWYTKVTGHNMASLTLVLKSDVLSYMSSNILSSASLFLKFRSASPAHQCFKMKAVMARENFELTLYFRALRLDSARPYSALAGAPQKAMGSKFSPATVASTCPAPTPRCWTPCCAQARSR